MNSKKYTVFVFLLASCTCFGSIGGAFQVERILAILLSPYLFSIISKEGLAYARKISRVLLLCYAYMAISFIWTPDKVEGAKELMYYPVHFLIFIELIVFSKYARNPLKTLSNGWLIAVILCSIVAIWEINTNHHLSVAIEMSDLMNTGTEIIQHRTASVTFGNYNSYVTFLCFSFPWIFYILVDEDRKMIGRILTFIVISVASYTIVRNASRGGVITILIMLVVYWFYSKKSSLKNLLFFVAISLMAYGLIHYGGETITAFEARSADGRLLNGDSRMVIWKDALKAFANTLGFGVGIGGITEAMRSVVSNGILSPHNMLLEILVQYGIVITYIVVLFLWRLYKKSRKVELNRKMVLMISFFTMPAYAIIDSGYLLSTHTYVLIASIYVFSNYELIYCPYEKSVNQG